MNNIITDIKALKEETLLNLQNSKANNTIFNEPINLIFMILSYSAYRMDLSRFHQNLKLFHYIITSLSSKDIKMSTLKRRLVSIGVIHKLKGHYLDTKHPLIIENIMGIKRRKGSSSKWKKTIINQ